MLTQDEIARIGRYISGTADQDDRTWVEDFFSHGHGNPHLKRHLENDWRNVLHEPHVKDIKLSGILDRVHHRIREKESQKRRAFLYRVTKVYIKAAAVLLLPLLLAGGLYVGWFSGFTPLTADRQAGSAIYAPMGSRVSFNLPDGTTGWLNSGSTLTYSLPFSKNRKVMLEGEAWFDVFHDEKHLFEISAGESKIKVLGTSFNVSAYPGEKYVEVILRNGKVEFSDRSQTEKVILKPSEQLILQEGRLHVNPVDASKYKAWTEGRLVFRGDNMAEVARRIERWYNVDVEIADDDLARFSFRATFENDALEDVLMQLSMTSPIQYEILPRKQLPDGTSMKKRIVLYKTAK
ncbi:MAG: DUF4974 domain-containing protein [Mangrovibacterium sp.]|nr:DUF4974 domain-containing protein [Mangrovibacterium sp.]